MMGKIKILVLSGVIALIAWPLNVMQEFEMGLNWEHHTFRLDLIGGAICPGYSRFELAHPLPPESGPETYSSPKLYLDALPFQIPEGGFNYWFSAGGLSDLDFPPHIRGTALVIPFWFIALGCFAMAGIVRLRARFNRVQSLTEQGRIDLNSSMAHHS